MAWAVFGNSDEGAAAVGVDKEFRKDRRPKRRRAVPNAREVRITRPSMAMNLAVVMSLGGAKEGGHCDQRAACDSRKIAPSH
jgi:hypothetical protein